MNPDVNFGSPHLEQRHLPIMRERCDTCEMRSVSSLFLWEVDLDRPRFAQIMILLCGTSYSIPKITCPLLSEVDAQGVLFINFDVLIDFRIMDLPSRKRKPSVRRGPFVDGIIPTR